MEGAMFTVHRQEFNRPLPHGACHQLARCDKNLLVRQPDSFPSQDGFVGRDQPCGPIGSGQDNVYLRVGRGLDLPTHSAGHLNGSGKPEMSKPLSKGLEALPTCDYDQLWGEISDLLGK